MAVRVAKLSEQIEFASTLARNGSEFRAQNPENPILPPSISFPSALAPLLAQHHYLSEICLQGAYNFSKYASQNRQK